MALPTWPVSISSSPLYQGYAMPEPFRAPLESDMEGGNTRRRSKPGDNVATIEFSREMTNAQWETIFYPWLLNDLSRAASRFTADVWLGSSLVTKVCQFVGVPTMKPVSDRHVTVSMKMRVYGIGS